MKTIKRLPTNGTDSDIQSLLSQSSNNQCFLVEKRSEDSKELDIFYSNSENNLSDAYLFYNKFLENNYSLKNNTIFNDLFDPCNEKYSQKQFFYISDEIRNGIEVYTIGFLNKRAKNTIDFVSKVIDESKFSQDYI